MKIIAEPLEFEWDKGNIDKNRKHGIENKESEEVFSDEERFIFKDHIHSGREERFRILGKTKAERALFVVFTIRGKKVRIISARDINKKERRFYEEKIKNTKI